MEGTTNAWLDGELAGCSLADERLTKRLRKLLAQIGSAMGQSIPLVCQDWANAKAGRLRSHTLCGIRDPEEVQGYRCAQQKTNPKPEPIDKKESVRWLDSPHAPFVTRASQRSASVCIDDEHDADDARPGPRHR